MANQPMKFSPRTRKTFNQQRNGNIGARTAVDLGRRGEAIGTDANTYDISDIVAQANINPSLQLSITTGGSYVAGTDIPLLPSYSATALPANVTATIGGFASYATFALAYGLSRYTLGNLKISTTDAANFDKPLKVTVIRGDGQSISNTTSWNQLSKNPANYDQTWREIPNLTFMSGVYGIQYWLDDMVVSTTMTFYFDIIGINNVTPTSAI